jgi:hypothetical protein
MSDAQIAEVQRQARFLYSLDPSVKLTYVSSGGNLNAITDTRLKSGASSVSVSSFTAETSTGEPIPVLTHQQHVNQNVYSGDSEAIFDNIQTTADSNNRKFPCYLDGSNNVVAMGESDFIDTFIKPAIAAYDTLDTTNDSVPGIYHVQSGTSFSGSTLASATPIFVDTRADADSGIAFFGQNTSGGTTFALARVNIGTAGTSQDVNRVISSHNLFLKNGAAADYTIPLHVLDANGDIFTPDSATFNAVLQNMMRYSALHITGAKINYQLVADSDTTTTFRGSGITNTIMNGSGQKIDQNFGADDYRSQEIPNGSAVTANTYFLGITIT